MHVLYTVLAFFMIYAFLGWALEVAFHVVSVGQFINRGFLNGPICPIYGVGMVAVITIMEPLTDNLWLLFIGGLIFATAIELVGGFVLYKLFHMRWWDYSSEPFNLGGYICPKFSLAWGICIVFAVDIVHPGIARLVSLTEGIAGYIIETVLMAVFIADLVVTVLTVMKLNRDLEQINVVAADIRKISDNLTDRIGNTTLKAANTVQRGQIQANLAKAEMRDGVENFRQEMRDSSNGLKAEVRDNLTRVKDEMDKYSDHYRGFFGYGRLYKAFPQMKHDRYNEELKLLLENIKTNSVNLKIKTDIKNSKK